MKEIIEEAWQDRTLLQSQEVKNAIIEVIDKLTLGQLRVAEPTPDGNWKVNEWVKKAVILYFPIQETRVMTSGILEYYDKINLIKTSRKKVLGLYRVLWQDMAATLPKT